MKIVRFAVGDTVHYGILEENSIRSIQGDIFGDFQTSSISHSLDRVKLLSPCEPSKIVAVGLNYRSHALETKNPIPRSPIIFLKPPTAVIGPGDDIVYPPDTTRVDYECELAIVIKEKARFVRYIDALDYVLGYTCINDVTARDHQRDDGQWTRGKGHDTFAPIGPWIETEMDPSAVAIKTVVNGEVKQKGNTSDLIFSVPEIISFISNVMTLLPGDVIATGTPAGIGPIQPGDTVDVIIENIGKLTNHVVSYKK